jgi:hypothetical protein
MVENLVIFSTAAVGAALQELLYWYDIYKRLEFKKYNRLMNSASYWAIVSAFIVMTGLVAIIWFSGGPQPIPRDVFVFGISLPLIIKQVYRARPGQIKLGTSDEYFDVR